MILPLFGVLIVSVAICGAVPPPQSGLGGRGPGAAYGGELRYGHGHPSHPTPSPPNDQNENPHTCGFPITRSKPGLCPPADDGIQCIWCNDNCRSDYDCSGNSICCQHGCGNTCRRAY